MYDIIIIYYKTGVIFVSVDVLQEKIRKTKNPSVLVLDVFEQLIPPRFAEEAESTVSAFDSYFSALLQQLKGVVPAVRFGFAGFSMLGGCGLSLLAKLSKAAKDAGYYVLLDLPEALSAMSAENMASRLSGEECPWCWDGLVVNAYLGSDVIKSFLPLCKKGKTLFPVVRTANRSAPEIQDLLTGGRLVHTAAADIISRQGEACMGKCGYSQVGALAGASAANGLKALRAKYPAMFLLLDGYDYPNANAKNCSYAFDKLGHGAAACAGISVTGAWQVEGAEDPFAAAREAAERMKKNLTRYITVL